MKRTQSIVNFDFDDFYDQHISYGVSQFQSLIGCSLTLMADGAEIFVIGFILTVLKSQFLVTQNDLSWLGTFIFLGSALGGIASGPWVDTYGRRNPYLISTLVQAISAVLSSLPTNYWLFLFFRFVFMFCAGVNISINPTYAVEILPQSVRGKFYCLMVITFAIGQFIVVILASMTMKNLNQGNWRALLFFAAIPSLISFISCYYYMRESPRYLLLFKPESFETAITYLQEMASENFKEKVQLTQDQRRNIKNWAETERNRQNNLKAQAQYTDLLDKSILKVTLLLMASWFSFSFIQYGISFTLPMVIQRLYTDSVNGEINSSGSTDTLNEQNEFNFNGMCIAIMSALPSSILAIFLADNPKYGRKNTIFISFLVTTISCFFIGNKSSTDWLFFFFVSTIQFFINIVIILIYPFTAEIYDTKLRAIGIGFHATVCQLSGALMPFIVVYSFTYSSMGPFWVFFVISLISTISSYFLSDTTGRKLDNYQEYVQLVEK